MIPKIIHFVWINTHMPEFARHTIEWFRQLNPDCRVMVHDEKSLSARYKPYYDQVHQVCAKADILRLSVLREYGGWYFDCDFVPLRPISAILDRYPGLEDVFLTRQSDEKYWDQSKVVANGIIGISTHTPAWDTIDNLVAHAAQGEVGRTMFGPSLMTHLVREHPELVTVAKTRDFYIWPLGRHGPAKAFFLELVAHGWSWARIVARFDKEHGAEDKVPIAFHLWAGGGSADMVPRAVTWCKPPSTTPRLVLVANNHGRLGNYNSIINDMDVVIRMNRCIGYGNEQFRMGQKTTVWACISAGKDSTGQYKQPLPYMVPGGRVGDQIEQVWFSRPEGWGNVRGNDESEAIQYAQRIRSEVLIRWPSSHEWEGLIADLRTIQDSFDSPSTGMVSVYLAMHTPVWAEYDIYTVGFTHSGWPGHPFGAERELMAEYVSAGSLRRLEDYTELPEEDTC